MDADKLAELAVAALDDLKAVNTVTVDVRELTDVTDYHLTPVQAAEIAQEAGADKLRSVGAVG